MSEELIERNLIKNGTDFGEYELFLTYNTTINQYKNANIISKINYGKYSNRKPDGLIIDRQNRKLKSVLVVLEYKKPSEFQTDKQKKAAVEQCNTLCQVLKSKIGIITDGIVTLWINPNQDNLENTYSDETGVERSYSYILNEDKQKIQTPFQGTSSSRDITKLDDPTRESYEIIKKILQNISPTNSVFKKTPEVDPLNLAKTVWQDIYVNTGKDPTKCLYNVVELFIFRFLSDLDVLTDPYDMNTLMKMYESHTNKDVLEYYSKVCRPQIKKLFPPGNDGTTILNGTIFVDRDGNPVESQANLFRSSVTKYATYSSSFKNIKKEFKTKLFESFLKQSNDKSRLGQFFTPRKVVKAIVEMADVDKATFICDPFCGVGGFILEPLQIYAHLKNQFQPANTQRVKFLGWDKGSDDDEHRTIILAKANMMIYLSDLIEKNPQRTDEFSKYFNDTFQLITDTNLGTLKHKFETEADKPDLILSNPPYVRKGSKSLRDEIIEENLDSEYKISGVGVEGLALRWIINNLRKGGKAFVIIPNGILDNLDNEELRKSILNECYINLIISLPMKTFFNTNKKTYILGLEKKHDTSYSQDFPIFTYLTSSIGESLDAYRFETEDNDLEKAKTLYNQFKGSKHSFIVDDPKCKIIDFDSFKNKKYWITEQFWSDDELIDIGIKKEKDFVTIGEYGTYLEKLIEKISISKENAFKIEEEIENTDFIEIPITQIMEIHLGIQKYDQNYINDNPGEYPVYSAKTTDDGVMGTILTYDWDTECLTWSVDGSYPGMVFHRNGKFSMTTHCGMLKIKDEYRDLLDYGYLYNILNDIFPNFAKGNGNKRLKKTHIEKDVESIKIPVDDKGNFDLEKQREIAQKHTIIRQIKSMISEKLEEINKLDVIIH